ncbi:MAG: FtsX-like permease family protein [Candidatus Lokiarchaeota archaeon]|nr:FtsX-like permease family protein [Candidatus Lokiarchaeota archaeon]
MSSFDFALKDFYRKKNQTIPYLVIIILVIAITEFLFYFTSSLGLNIFVQSNFSNELYFSGSISKVYKQFISIVQILMMILAISIVIVISTTHIINRKKDIGIMKALGTLPRRLYSFYLIEVYIIFFIGFFLGLISGLLSFAIFSLIFNIFYFNITFQIDVIFSSILFTSCFFGIFFISGYSLRRIGRENVVKSFSKDIPHNYDASKNIQFIPKWLSSLGINIKQSIINTLRRKSEFKRYLIVFSLICLIIFTLGLGTVVLRTSSEEWIHKSQGENIIIIGHEDVIQNYSMMFEMFSDPRIFINETDINFTNSKYLFNSNNVSNIKAIFSDIEKVDERLINFCDIEEMSKTVIINGDYVTYGKHRTGNFPIIGVNFSNLIQNFEIEGNYSTLDFEMIVGDGLAYNYFDKALIQNLKINNVGNEPHQFEITGVIIDSFYSGYAGYVDLESFQEKHLLNNNTINIILLKLKKGAYNNLKTDLETYIKSNLGNNFTHMKLDGVFKQNMNFLLNLSLYPTFLIIIMAILGILSLYNYQKSGIMEKARDFLIMKALGARNKAIKRILFLESIFILIPSLLISLGIGMILNSTIIFGRVYLPPLFVPLTVFIVLVATFIFFNYLSLIPIMKKVNKFSIKDFEIY